MDVFWDTLWANFFRRVILNLVNTSETYFVVTLWSQQTSWVTFDKRYHFLAASFDLPKLDPILCKNCTVDIFNVRTLSDWTKSELHCFILFFTPENWTKWITVKPMYNDHSWDPKKVAVVGRWSLFRGHYLCYENLNGTQKRRSF